jgi:hypothetical protein
MHTRAFAGGNDQGQSERTEIPRVFQEILTKHGAKSAKK